MLQGRAAQRGKTSRSSAAEEEEDSSDHSKSRSGRLYRLCGARSKVFAALLLLAAVAVLASSTRTSARHLPQMATQVDRSDHGAAATSSTQPVDPAPIAVQRIVRPARIEPSRQGPRAITSVGAPTAQPSGGQPGTAVGAAPVVGAGRAADGPAPRPPVRVGLVMLIIDAFPSWWPFLVESYGRNAPHYELIVVHTGPRLPLDGRDAHVRYEPIAKVALASLFASQLGADAAQVQRKFASAKGLSDLKPFYGKVFESFLPSARYTHWGWVDWDIFLGDVRSVVPDSTLWEWDAVTFAGATLGFAWAGQVTVMRNAPRLRELYRVVEDHLALGFKSHGDGQSGWEERVFLREVLRKAPATSILFHMAAQVTQPPRDRRVTAARPPRDRRPSSSARRRSLTTRRSGSHTCHSTTSGTRASFGGAPRGRYASRAARRTWWRTWRGGRARSRPSSAIRSSFTSGPTACASGGT